MSYGNMSDEDRAWAVKAIACVKTDADVIARYEEDLLLERGRLRGLLRDVLSGVSEKELGTSLVVRIKEALQ